jgi:hypothetical protein
MRDNSLGIYCLKDKTFYYLESGKVYVSNTIDRIKKTLISRGLIEFSPESHHLSQNYKIVTCRDAKLEDYTMQPIYISANVRKYLEENTEKEATGSWGKE